MIDKTPKLEKVVLAGLHIQQTPKNIFDEDLAEMELLCTTAGTQVVQTIVQKAQKPLASTYFGSGKLKEIKRIMEENDCETFVIDAELRPSQIQNIEEIIEKKNNRQKPVDFGYIFAPRKNGGGKNSGGIGAIGNAVSASYKYVGAFVQNARGSRNARTWRNAVGDGQAYNSEKNFAVKRKIEKDRKSPPNTEQIAQRHVFMCACRLYERR